MIYFKHFSTCCRSLRDYHAPDCYWQSSAYSFSRQHVPASYLLMAGSRSPLLLLTPKAFNLRFYTEASQFGGGTIRRKFISYINMHAFSIGYQHLTVCHDSTQLGIICCWLCQHRLVFVGGCSAVFMADIPKSLVKYLPCSS